MGTSWAGNGTIRLPAAVLGRLIFAWFCPKVAALVPNLAVSFQLFFEISVHHFFPFDPDMECPILGLFLSFFDKKKRENVDI